MPDFKPLPDAFRPGGSRRQLSARGLNEIRDAAVQQITGTDGINVSKIGRRMILTPNGEETIPDNELRTFSIVGIDYDVLTCVIYDYTGAFSYDVTLGSAVPSSQYVYIAKASLLQKSPWDGKTVTIDGVDYTYTYLSMGTRSVTWTISSVSHSRVEAVTPDYFIGEIITARQSYSGYTHSGLPVLWEDINEAGRGWATVDSGVTVDQLVLIGAGSLNADGMYPGTIQLETITGTFTAGAACWVEEANGQRLVVGKTYNCKLAAGVYAADSKPLFCIGDPVFGFSGTTHAPGAVPDPGATRHVTDATFLFLGEAGWAVPPPTHAADPDLSVQYNNDGQFGGDGQFTFDDVTKELDVGLQEINAPTYGSKWVGPSSTYITFISTGGANISGSLGDPLSTNSFFSIAGGFGFFEIEDPSFTPDLITTVAVLNENTEIDGGFERAAGRFQWYNDQGVLGGSGYGGPTGTLTNRAILGTELDAVRSEGPINILGHLKTNQLTGASVGATPETYWPVYDRDNVFVGYIPVFPAASGGPPPPPPPPPSGSGGSGGGGGIVSIGLDIGTTGVSSATTLTITAVPVAANSLLIVIVDVANSVGTPSPSVTFNGVSLTAGPSVANPNAVTGVLQVFYLHVISPATANVVVTSSSTAQILAEIVQVTGLVNFTVDQSVSARGNQPTPGMPNTGTTGTTTVANEYVQAAFFLQVPSGGISWGGGFGTGGQDVSASFVNNDTLTEGCRIVSFTGTFNALLTPTTAFGWCGLIVTFS